MSSTSHKILENVFFFAILAGSAYLVWQLFVPFAGALALAAIIVTICYPMHERILLKVTPRRAGLAAFLSLLVVILVIVIPLTILASFILREALSIYQIFNTSDHISVINTLTKIESTIQTRIPEFSFDTAAMVQQSASFIVDRLVSIFTGTASTIFLLFIALFASYYFFKDGKHFTSYLIKLSPLKDVDDALILSRLAIAVRSVALGTVSVAMLQGFLTAIGLTIFGFDRAILWGCIAAIGALVPGIGTSIVFIPSVIYLLYTGSQFNAIALAIWGALAVGLIDNMVGPYVMSRGNNVHPFLILISVLGGIALFGPLGFILGPVILSLFLVLLEMYHIYIKKNENS